MHPNEALVRRYFTEVWNEGNVAVLDEIIASDYVNHSPGMPNPAPGPDGLMPIITAMRQGFPDLHYEILHLVVTDDQVAAHTLMQGTHTGNFFGMSPTDKKINVAQMQIEKISNGKIVEHWRVTDDMTFMKQLGQIE